MGKAVKIDPEFEALIPPLSAEEYETLKENILLEGCRDPLVLWKGVLLDGHNRYRICEANCMKYETVSIRLRNRDDADRDDAKAWIINNQLGRRNISLWVRGKLSLLLKPIFAAKAKEAQKRSRGRGKKGLENSTDLIDTREEVAKAAGVSSNTIAKIEKIIEKGTDEVKEQLDAGEMSVNQAHNEIQLTERKEKRRRERTNTTEELFDTTVALDRKLGPFSVIYADPPWQRDNNAESRDVRNHYPTMTTDEICDLAVPDISTPDAILFMWAISPMLPEALRVMEAWGFTYKTNMAWVKGKEDDEGEFTGTISCGWWVRQQHELLLIGTRGTMATPPPSHRPPSALISPRTKHSAKPLEFYAIIEAMYPDLAKVELFSRTPRDGWQAWGNEAGDDSLSG